MANPVVYTAAQRKVIDHSGSNLLVSASAGTGKTTVMVERIYQLISSGKVDISNIMVVTFTTLAASEMKQRLATKLSGNRDNQLVASQLDRIDSCAISTMHSFCADLIRQYFYVVDVDPSYSILDAVTAKAFQQTAITDVLNHYGSSNDRIYDELSEIFSTKRNSQNFIDEIIRQYDFSRDMVDYNSWYKGVRNNYLLDGNNQLLSDILIEDIKASFGDISARWRSCGEQLDVIGMPRHAEACYQRSVQLMINASDDVDMLSRWIYNIELTALPKVMAQKLPDGVDKPYVDSLLKSVKADTKLVIDKYGQLLSGGWDNIMASTDSSVKYIDKLVELVNAFTDRYTELKKRRGVLDYSDLEHLAIDILHDENAIRQVKDKYRMIFVDEYQDTNNVQECIINSIAGSDNLFVVGDIKQSIYAFRGSNPTLFTNRLNGYQTNGSGEVALLNENFRSDRRILDFVNMVFNKIMTSSFGSIDYRSTSQLVGSMCLDGVAVNIDIVSKDKPEPKPLDDLYDITKVDDEDNVVDSGQVVAQRIMQLIGSTITLSDGSTKRLDYGDFVVLSRSIKNDKTTNIVNALIENNIPVQSAVSSSIHGKEIRDIVTLLRIIDNPTDDISMTGACLAIYGKMTHQMLADVAIATKHLSTTWIERLTYYASNYMDNVSDSITSLLNLIARLRLISQSTTVDQVLLELLSTTQYNLHVQALPNGQLRVKQLYDFIAQLVGKSYNQSIDKLLKYFDDSMEDSKKDVSPSGNAVTIMTMHGSKGLEFPVVFVVNLDTEFNVTKSKLARNVDIGLAIDSYDFDKMSYSQTIGTYCTKLALDRKSKEEEMRVLYVALTRAKYRLILVAEGNKCLSAKIEQATSSRNYINWIMASYNASYDNYDSSLCDGVIVTVWNNHSQLTSCIDTNRLVSQSDNIDEHLASINYTYPHAIDNPSKVVSSQLDKDNLTDSEKHTAPTLTNYDSDVITIGTAYHAVYQVINIDSSVADIDLAIRVLVDKGIVLPHIASSVDSQTIYNTLNNQQFRQLLVGDIYHEIPFMLNHNDSLVGGEGNDDIILQGIIDMLVVNGDRAVVIDYKYTNNSRSVKAKYAKQLDSYKLAVSKIIGIDNVDAYVLSIRDNKLIAMQ